MLFPIVAPLTINSTLVTVPSESAAEAPMEKVAGAWKEALGAGLVMLTVGGISASGALTVMVIESVAVNPTLSVANAVKV